MVSFSCKLVVPLELVERIHTLKTQAHTFMNIEIGSRCVNTSFNGFSMN